MKKKEFTSLFQGGKRVRGKHYSLQCAHRDARPSVVSIVVQSKIFPRATERNRIRRVLSEAIRTLLPLLKESYTISVIVHSPMSEDNPGACAEEITALLKKSGMIE